MKCFGAIILSILLFQSCLEIEPASIEPELSYLDHEVVYSPSDFGSTDYEVKLILKVKDGDGDIVNESVDDPRKNLFLTMYRPSTGDTSEVNMKMPFIENRNTLSVLIGEMQVFHRYENFDDPLVFKDTLNYDIYIKDHAGNESDIVTINGIIIHTNPDSNRVQ